MNEKGDRIRQSMSLGISLLMLTLSVAVPLLERGEFLRELAVEHEHDPAACPRAHDQKVCMEVSVDPSVVSETHDHQLARGGVSVARALDAPQSSAAVFFEGHPSRAPPLV